MNKIRVLESIPVRQVPHQTKLFLDYLELSPEVLAFYGARPDLAAVERIARSGISGISLPRREISAILRAQNERFGGNDLAGAHISDLERSDAVAIVTGQQVGLFGGPLYTVYKSLTCIRLAQKLRENGVRAVPVFWMDSEDHDLAEVTHLTLLDEAGTTRTLDLREPLFGTVREGAEPVGGIRLPDSIDGVLADYLSAIPEGPWKPETAANLTSAYQPGVTFAGSFARLMSRLFRDYGLVLFDPCEPETKKLLSGVFQKAIRQSDEIHSLLADRSRMLQERGLHAQVHVLENSTVLFCRDAGGERRAVVRHGGRFQLKGTGTEYEPAELAELAELEPARLSPNVLLRPIVQDLLLPTAAYVAGPAETAYFAQVQVLYGLFGRPMPVIWPRASFTLIEAGIHSLMQRCRIRVEDCFEGKHHLVEKMIQGCSRSGAVSILKSLETELDAGIAELHPAIAAADASLGPALETARRKVFHHIDSLRAKFVHAETRRDTELLRDADLLIGNCYPNRNLQERELTVHRYLARYGPDLLTDLMSVVDTGGFDHKLIGLEAP